MYPTIAASSSADADVPLIGSSLSARQSLSTRASNGPPPPPPPGAPSPSVPVLRVKIADHLNMPPPDALQTAVPDTSANAATVDCSMERDIVRGTWQPPSSAKEPPPTTSAFDEAVAIYTGMGYEREEVCIALTVFGLDVHQQDKVVEFAKQYSTLKSMGFAAPLVAGALLRCDNDLSAATDACLAASMNGLDT